MVNRSAWTGGNLNAGSLAYQLAFGSEIATLNTSQSVLSSIIFDNTTGEDEFLDLSAVGTIASSTIAAGSVLNFWLCQLQGDGTTYGDGRLTTTPSTYVPLGVLPLGGISVQIGTAITHVVGGLNLLSLPPCKFSLGAQNLVGDNFATMQVWIRTYNQNLNN
jgi:hypothetical protein